MFEFSRDKTTMVGRERALLGRTAPMVVPESHTVLNAPLKPGEEGWPNGLETATVAMGCFWGAERQFWQLHGVYTTAVGYTGGYTPNPTYEEVCTGLTGHAESVLVVFDPQVISYAEILRSFWEGHDPTQGMRQGNDVGTQYRSAVFFADDTQRITAQASRTAYQERLTATGYGEITTEISPAGPFFYAESYHQQYLDKNPGGYCGLGGTGVSCPVGLQVR
ncbi:MAG: peptide-methionine (S)-S-oxide reductase MsrA [Solirubrobacteraceae bacterium]